MTKWENLDKNTRNLLLQLVDEVEKHRPWEWSDFWKTQSSYFSWLRGSFRGIWSRKWVLKNEYVKTRKFDKPTIHPNGDQAYFKTGKRKGLPVTHKAFKCEITGEILPMKLGQVDHIAPAGSCRNGLEACIFLFKLLTSKDNMRLISKDAHAIVTYMEKTGMSWEEAVIEKSVIEKMKQKVNAQKYELIEHGFSVSEVNNKYNRKKCYIKMLSK